MILKDTNIFTIKQINSLESLGIYTSGDLLNYYPYRYEIIKRSPLIDGEKVTTDGIVSSNLTLTYLNHKRRIAFKLNTGDNLVNIWIYNRAFLTKVLKEGIYITVFGKYNKWKNLIVASEVKLGKLPEKTEVTPIYHTKNKIKSNEISLLIKKCFLTPNIKIADYIPKSFSEQYKFISKKDALINIHYPKDLNLLKQARLRLKYEELFTYMLKIRYMKEKLNTNKCISRKICPEEIDKFISSLYFKLTPDQEKSVNEILNDMALPKRMNRLLQGDVGSGKTIVSFIAAYYNYLSSYQTAYMAPTEILAKQHYENALKLFKNTNMNIKLLTSSTKQKEKKEIYNDLEQGKINLIIGTQSLVQDNLKFYDLGLVITDEQHRFGVNQRTILKNKGNYPDILSMSATPIPRTYALTIYGDMDVSSIKTKPQGRKEIITKIYNEKDILEVLKMMYEELKLDHQIYVIAPLIDEGNNDLENVKLLEEKMNKAFGKKYKIASLHGNMDNEKKEAIMKLFSNNKINILISTTVIEVGVDVKNASMIVIFDANNFGLSTIHQLRGRVGRGDIQSYCLLITKIKSDRLNILKETNDGFKISEFDFKNRGYGELFGVKQSGEFHFKIADIKTDYKILLQAKKDAETVINDYFNKRLDNLQLYKELLESDNLN